MSNTNTEVLTTAYEKLQKALTQSNTVLPKLEEAVEKGNLDNYAKASDLEEKANKDDVANISNGTPLFASSTTEMTDTTKNYVNLADGYLYIYNGTTFEKSDVLYQATGIADGSIDVKKFDSLLAEKFKSIIIESKETLSTYMINGVDTTSKNINENSITYTTNSSYGTFGWNVENKSNSKFIFINQLENLGSVDSNYKFMIGYKSDSFSGSIKLNGEEITSSSVINAGATINCNLVVEPGKTPDEYPVFGLCVFTTTNGATLKLTQKIYNVTNLSDDEINSINWDNPTSSIQLISDISKKAKSLDSIYEESLKSDIIKILPEPVQKIVIDTIGKEKLISPPSSENITTYMKNGVDVSTIQQTDNIIEFTTNTTYGTVGLCVSNAIDNKYVAVSTVSNLGEVESSISLLSAYGESSIGGSVSVNGDFYDTFNLGVGESKKCTTIFTSKATNEAIALCVYTKTNGSKLQLTQKIYNVTNLSDDEINSINWDNPSNVLTSDIANYANDLSLEAKLNLLTQTLLNKWYGKTCLSIGDSLSAARKWQLVLESRLGMIIKHHSKGGIGLVQMVDGDKGLGGDYDNETDASGELKPLSVKDVTGVDLIIFFGGYNNRGTADGELGDVYNPNDQTGKTIAGMTQYCINRIYEVLKQANNLTCKILIVTPHCAGKYDYIDADGYDQYPAGSGYTLETLANTMKLVGNYNNIRVLDLWHNSGINKFTWDVYANKSSADNTATYTRYELNSSGEIVGTTPLRYVKGNSYYQIRDGVVTLEQYTGSAPYPYNNDQLHLNPTEGYPHIGGIIANEIVRM